MLTFSQPDRLSDLLAKWGREPAILYVAADSSVRVPTDAASFYAPSDADEVLAKAPPAPDSAS